MDKAIVLHSAWSEDEEIGILYINREAGKEKFSFSYSEKWLEHHSSLFIDSEIQSFPGRQYPKTSLFGCLTDMQPDRWGRQLIIRRELNLALQEKRPVRPLMESDFLLEVSDFSRQGGIRLAFDGGFISRSESDAPPMTRLKALQEASRSFQSKDEKTDWIKELVPAGSSLGGARPKANVTDEKNCLWIAKFSSLYDIFQVENWEALTWELAALCNLTVPEIKTEKITDNLIFLTKRFDREKEHRKHFISAMTALGKTDGDSASFLEIADWIRRHQKDPSKDLQELWRRIAFSVLVSNTDCHLRNHGFLLEKDQWRLSPMYDVNPNPLGTYMALAIDDKNTIKDINTVLQTASFYEISDAKAEVEKMKAIIHDHFQRLVDKYSIPRKEALEMQQAFSVFQEKIKILPSISQMKKGWKDN
ncbi:type II toxin-antitoxin system HipA family toxin [Negativicoccus succinicivorans]|uniref:type II toxin-antitoxin system HipA family toxin n=1 Tax=Negativicoccus succinicivorans TaxID=620903 RepID=UPI0028FEC073|nr:type II toxin-antitoxin system HipA family toxin [Negativicoccus succinicivorans]MDU0987156.1 type II toxin-antitoxin system HipA family toxin [Negativicoccus succinicivorans]MDU1066570.1 type II toxin-antitoxin system HipA family toxin [Negativicoccus succinicivorans]MDU2929804.1 type II toxin-antitoxin system HipA family toxin [Negativicoccus succinicivorans]MDU5648874.1 type II toxin-antitoxin system HipA family toxin [Haemophilus parainfluenzae]